MDGIFDRHHLHEEVPDLPKDGRVLVIGIHSSIGIYSETKKEERKEGRREGQSGFLSMADALQHVT